MRDLKYAQCYFFDELPQIKKKNEGSMSIGSRIIAIFSTARRFEDSYSVYLGEKKVIPSTPPLLACTAHPHLSNNPRKGKFRINSVKINYIPIVQLSINNLSKFELYWSWRKISFFKMCVFDPAFEWYTSLIRQVKNNVSILIVYKRKNTPVR